MRKYIAKDIVMVCLSGRQINQDIYTKRYMYSLGQQKLLEPKMTDKKDNGKYWEDVYYMIPGKYLIVEIDLDNIKHNCTCKLLRVFTRDDYLSDKREKIPNIDIKEFEALYHYGGSEIVEWEGYIPDWVELPCKCLYHWKRTYDILEIEDGSENESEEERQKRLNYQQPKEVEDKLSSLLSKEDDGETRTSAKFLVSKHKKTKK